MSLVRLVKTNFTAGEVGPDLLGRADLRAYENGALALRNLFIFPTGGVTRRAGLRYIDTVEGDGRLVSFEFNTEQTYLLVLTHESIAVYADGAKVADLAAPWSLAQIPQVTWTQSADTLLLVHPDVPPKKLVRNAMGAFALQDWIYFIDDNVMQQPYYKFADSAVTITPSATTATITVTSSANVFEAGHAGTRMRIGNKEVIVTSISSPTVATADVIEDLADTNATIDWAEQAFSEVRGYPVSVAFHQDRLVIGGSRDLPNRLWFSKSGDLFNFDLGTGLDTNNPCYWNNFDRVLVEEPAVHGIHLTKTGDGDTPNANKFHACRVYSHGADISGHGIYVEHGQYNNAFIDCEANVKGTAQGCFTMGAGSYKTLLVNPYAESFNGVPNVKLEVGSDETSVHNLLSMSDGAAIWDLSGGKYSAVNAGFPYKNRLLKTTVVDMNATLQRYDTEYIDASGEVTLDLSHSVHLVSSFGGALTVKLPKAEDSPGVMMVVKKTDSSGNVITIAEDDGNGPDGRSYYLGADNDFVQVLSNGAEWFVISSNRAPGNTRFHDGSGTYDIDMAVDTYLISSYGGALTARLPPANAAISVGRTITIKKTDPSSNVITVTEYGGSGPDGYGQPLNEQYKAITVVSNGSQWYIVNRF